MPTFIQFSVCSKQRSTVRGWRPRALVRQPPPDDLGQCGCNVTVRREMLLTDAFYLLDTPSPKRETADIKGETIRLKMGKFLTPVFLWGWSLDHSIDII